MSAAMFIALAIVWLNAFAALVLVVRFLREQRFRRYANKAIDLTGGTR